MSIKHILFALLVIIIWGCNFIFIRFGVAELPPLFLCFMRFLLASVPAIFFIKPPATSVKLLMVYGLLMFGLQFAFLFMGMKAGMTPGLASLIAQVQIFFSILFAAIWFDEMPSATQIIGGIVSFSGIGWVGLHLDHNITLAGFLLIIAASITWGMGNLVTKKIGRVNMVALVIWGSFIACFPLLACSLIFEGWQSIQSSLHHVTWLGAGSVLYIVYASTIVGYGIWNKLIGTYPIATVVPFTLLVPVVGLISSAIVLHEPMQSWKIMASLLVISGLVINLLGVKMSLKLATNN